MGYEEFCKWFYFVVAQETDSNKKEEAEKGSIEVSSEKDASDDAKNNLSNHSSPNKPANCINENSNDAGANNVEDKNDEADEKTKPSIKPYVQILLNYCTVTSSKTMWTLS